MFKDRKAGASVALYVSTWDLLDILFKIRGNVSRSDFIQGLCNKELNKKDTKKEIEQWIKQNQK